jgi:hypothetical protein
MNIDVDINEMFNEKNQTIFLETLKTELINNCETFKLSSKHVIMMETAKLLSALKKIYDKYKISIDEVEVRRLLINSKNGLIEGVNILIDDRTSKNHAYLDGSQNKKKNKSFLKDYHKEIDSNEEAFNAALTLVVNESAEIGLYKSLVSLYQCSSEEMQQDLLKAINVEFSRTIISRIVEQNKYRSMTLKNMSSESFDKYLEISKKTTSLTSPLTKVKVKTENNP